MKRVFPILLLVIFSIPSIFALLHSGFFQSDDGEWMIIRFSAFHQALSNGQFPVRFLGRLNYGYGYTVANFLYPGFMYLAEPIHLLGFGFVDSIKILLILSMVGSAVFACFWLRQVFNELSSFIGALFFLYTPYHLFDLYKRGSVGEIFALSIMPLIFWQIHRKSFFWLSVGIAWLILSHNTLTLLFLPVIALYIWTVNLRFPNKRQVMYRYASIFGLGLGLSSFFWIPAILELPYVQFSSISVSDPIKYFASLKLVGGSAIGVLIGGLFLFVYQRVVLNKSWSLVYSLFIFFAIICSVSVFLSTKASTFFWEIFPSSFIQFPFRFLSLILLSASFLSAYLVSFFRRYDRLFMCFVLLLSLFVSVYPYLSPTEFFDKGDSFYATNEGTTTVQDEYMPVWVKEKPTGHFKEKVEIIEGEGAIKDLYYNPSKKLVFQIQATTPVRARVNTIYYPGWKAYADGKEILIDYSNPKGVMDLEIQENSKKIELIFSETPLGLFADTLSFLAFAVLIITSFIKRRE